ncbi:HAD family hydrolase [Bacillus smithii]|nr:HAD hydrolase-like protein [Bacillus smithii]
MKHCYVTHRYGIHNAKPSPYCFMHIIEREKVNPHDVVYIGDNPKKDFVGIKPLGFKTIRVMTGQHRSIEMPKEYEADIRIESLAQLEDVLSG